MFTVIVAHDLNHNIADSNGNIPWKCPEDMAHFKNTTMGHIVIMGRKTYESIGKPLSGRTNIVISRTMRQPTSTAETKNNSSQPIGVDNRHTLVLRDIDQCIKWCDKHRGNKECFVIGGDEIYTQFINANIVNKAYITTIKEKNSNLNGTQFSQHLIFEEWNRYSVCDHDTYTISKYQNTNHSELSILHLLSDILSQGTDSTDRTGVGTKSLFGTQLKFDLTNGTFPLMTTRSLNLRMVFEELMWNLRGQTDSNILSSKKVPVWQKNTTEAFLKGRGLSYRVGDIGHAYGHSWRHFGNDEYSGCDKNYSGKGYDQLEWLNNEIRTNPSSRRLLISLWEPNNMHKAVLPPCLYSFQFYIRDGFISCMMTQRSSDIAVAGGWNVAYGALLTYMLGAHHNLKPKELIWNIGDVHIYNNLLDGVKQQLTRAPRIYPKLKIINKPQDLLKYEYYNIELTNYNPHPRIKFEMNA